MTEIQRYSQDTFESIKHINEYGQEYWSARELQPLLEYAEWRNFMKIIEKGKLGWFACYLIPIGIAGLLFFK